MNADLLVYQWGFLLVMISFNLFNRHLVALSGPALAPWVTTKSPACLMTHGTSTEGLEPRGNSKGAWGLGSDFYVSLVHPCPPWGG